MPAPVAAAAAAGRAVGAGRSRAQARERGAAAAVAAARAAALATPRPAPLVHAVGAWARASAGSVAADAAALPPTAAVGFTVNAPVPPHLDGGDRGACVIAWAGANLPPPAAARAGVFVFWDLMLPVPIAPGSLVWPVTGDCTHGTAWLHPAIRAAGDAARAPEQQQQRRRWRQAGDDGDRPLLLGMAFFNKADMFTTGRAREGAA